MKQSTSKKSAGKQKENSRGKERRKGQESIREINGVKFYSAYGRNLFPDRRSGGDRRLTHAEYVTLSL